MFGSVLLVRLAEINAFLTAGRHAPLPLHFRQWAPKLFDALEQKGGPFAHFFATSDRWGLPIARETGAQGKASHPLMNLKSAGAATMNEECTAAAQSLKSQAQQLVQAVAVFRLAHAAPGGAVVAA